jgi:hypothetical protein
MALQCVGQWQGARWPKKAVVVGRDCRGPILQTSPVRDRKKRGSVEREERLVEEKEREPGIHNFFWVSTTPSQAVQRQCFVAN